VQPVISLSDNALNHLHKLRAESGGDELLLRIGVKSGGCSGTVLVPHPKHSLLC
jgi:Fe-S cluster assembly iron-binding protein IscA